jgi:hypothetical protein
VSSKTGISAFSNLELDRHLGSGMLFRSPFVLLEVEFGIVRCIFLEQDEKLFGSDKLFGVTVKGRLDEGIARKKNSKQQKD